MFVEQVQEDLPERGGLCRRAGNRSVSGDVNLVTKAKNANSARDLGECRVSGEESGPNDKACPR